VKTLRGGYSTGTCAAAAAKAAAMMLSGNNCPAALGIVLPDGERVTLNIAASTVRKESETATASVVKFSGDDPDVTDGLKVTARVQALPGKEIMFVAGEGVGTVTKPGLSIPPGEPAINPVPRQMITEAVREITNDGLEITISIENGEAIAEKTFNSRLGIVGGLSVLGTSGRVVPYSCSAVRETFKCVLDVAVAGGVSAPVFVPGNIGRKAARGQFSLSEAQVIEVGNEWGYMIDELGKNAVDGLLVVGHPGKLAKLIGGHWDTHSKRSPSAVALVSDYISKISGTGAAQTPTVEGLFAALSAKESRTLGGELSRDIGRVIEGRLNDKLRVAVLLINMKCELLGEGGDFSHWEKRV
jgi:cobalt-precorrin-5B (C1)-methyltransferase